MYPINITAHATTSNLTLSAYLLLATCASNAVHWVEYGTEPGGGAPAVLSLINNSFLHPAITILNQQISFPTGNYPLMFD